MRSPLQGMGRCRSGLRIPSYQQACVVVSLRVQMDDPDRLRLGFKVRVGAPESRLACIPMEVGGVIDLRRHFALEIHVHAPTYVRFRSISSMYPLLEAPEPSHVLCQTKLGDPASVLNDYYALSCGRVEKKEEAMRTSGWRKTKSKVWVCSECYVAHSACVPIV